MPQSELSAVAKRASRLSISAHPVSPIVATTSLPINSSEDDLLDEALHDTELAPVEPGVRLSFGIFGISALMPWNAMITAMPYFSARLAGSAFASSFASWLSVTWTLMSFASLAWATWTANDVIPTARIALPLSVNTLLVTFLAITPRLTLPPGLFFALVLANGALQATLGAWFQTSVVALASVFGPDAIAAYMTGGALVAVGVSLLKLVTVHSAVLLEYERNPALASIHASKKLDGDAIGATIYFSIAASFIASGIVAYVYLYPRIPLDVTHTTPETPNMDQRSIETLSDQPTEVDYLLGRVSNTPVPMSSASIWIVARKNAAYNIAVFWVFVTTLAVFPSITTSILPTNNANRSIIFNPLIFSALHFLNFNLADLVGRALTAVKPISPTSDSQLLLYSLARTIFIPLFLLCNVRHKPTFDIHSEQSHHGPLFGDLVYMLILFAFGVTNGHASTLVLMSAPSKVMNPRLELYESKTAARIAQFSLVGGLVVGSVASFGLRAVECRCNPFVDQ